MSILRCSSFVFSIVEVNGEVGWIEGHRRRMSESCPPAQPDFEGCHQGWKKSIYIHINGYIGIEIHIYNPKFIHYYNITWEAYFFQHPRSVCLQVYTIE